MGSAKTKPNNSRPEYEHARRAYELGARVRALRDQRGWSQAELAKRVGMTTSDMARFEGGGAIPTLPVLERVADALDMRLSIALTPDWHA
jgi:transcriptional regulator with XRE-family HTH domain